MSATDPRPEAHADRFGNELYAPDPWAAAFADDEPAPPERPYKVDKAALWTAARLDYAAGHTAETICAAYDFKLSTFRQRARREGWRRSDLCEDGEAVERIPELEPAPPIEEMIEQAWRWVADALARGKPYEARTWMRLHKELKATLAAAEQEAHWQRIDAEREAQRAAAAPEPGADLHPLHPDDAVQVQADAAGDASAQAWAEVDRLERLAVAASRTDDYAKRADLLCQTLEAMDHAMKCE